jgi:type II secretory pathway pseudopilin PulG
LISSREKVCNYNNIMVLPAKSIIGFSHARRQDAGYAMAALLVTMSVMSIMLTVALPTWSHMMRREREEELIFRGEQYARAINSYQRKYANQSPANLDVLIKERMLRKKFKDPLAPTKDGEFQLLYFQTGTGPQGGGAQGSGTQGSGSTGTGSQGTGSRGTGSGSTGSGGFGGQSGSIGPSSGMGRGAVVGVVSKNTSQSIRTYKGRNRYSEWQFIGMELSQRAGGPGGAAGPGGGGSRGGPGGRGGTRDGRGGPSGTDRGGRGGSIYSTPDGGTTFTPRGGASAGPR